MSDSDSIFVLLNANDVMLEMDRADIDGDQYWAEETTEYDVDGAIISVSGPTVMVREV